MIQRYGATKDMLNPYVNGPYVKLDDLPKWRPIGECKREPGVVCLLRFSTGEFRIGWPHPDIDEAHGFWSLDSRNETIARTESITHFMTLDDFLRAFPVEGA